MLSTTKSHIIKPHRVQTNLASRIGPISQLNVSIREQSIIMDPQASQGNQAVINMAYSHCKTRIINMLDFGIPQDADENAYKKLYQQISKSRNPAAQALTDAISSVSLGIAPPVAFPTETVYGLGADATNRASIAGIFAAKGRPSDNPLIVHVASKEHLEHLTGEPIPEVYADLVKENWPGPLTILVPIPEHNSVFAPNVHPGQRTIGFRVPSSHFARFFISATGKPIAAPSANSSGKPSPTTAQHVLDDLKSKINFILDGGTCDVGVESTVVDGLHDPPLILRPGGLSQDDLIAHGQRFGNTWSRVAIGYKQSHGAGTDKEGIVNGMDDPSVGAEAPRAPGMKYKHYAPRGRMMLFEGPRSETKVRSKLDSLLDDIISASHDSPIMASKIRETPEESHDDKGSTRIDIAILTTTSWSPNAGIPVSTASDGPATQQLTNGDTHVGSSSGYSTTIHEDSHQIYHYRSCVDRVQTDIIVNVHSLALGTTPRSVAQNLFAALRSCDDLGCKFIFAESPDAKGLAAMSPGYEDELRYQFDAVLERMKKAASIVI